ncbi:MAG: hypothetical protein LBF06_17640, partial [Pseudomonas sp.]|nr:hypothetical protein [Pseudomonas sp.]
RLFFFKMSALRRSEAVHLKFAARQRSPEGLGDLPQDHHSFGNCGDPVGAGVPAKRPDVEHNNFKI